MGGRDKEEERERERERRERERRGSGEEIMGGRDEEVNCWRTLSP